MSLMNCFSLRNGSWLDDLYLSAICSLANVTTGKEVRKNTHDWLLDKLKEADKKTIRELLKDKYYILGVFLASKIEMSRSAEAMQSFRQLLERLIVSLRDSNWNNDPEFPAFVVFSLANTDLDLSDAKKYLLNNVNALWRQGKTGAAVHSLLGLSQFQEGRVAIAGFLADIGLFSNSEGLFSKLDMESMAILLLAVSEIGSRGRYLLYDSIERNLKNEFFGVRETVLNILVS